MNPVRQPVPVRPPGGWRKAPTATGPHCGALKASRAGLMWHHTHGERPCVTCNVSASAGQRMHRLDTGKAIRVNREDLWNLVLAFDRRASAGSDAAFTQALEVMLTRMEATG